MYVKGVVDTMDELKKLGIDMVTIPLPFRLNHVNCFIAEGKNGYTIIDAGLHDEAAIQAWDPIVKDRNVNEIIITHIHPDHSGYAGGLQEKTGATVAMTEADANTYEQIWTPSALPQLQKDYELAAVPENITKGIVDITQKFSPKISPWPKVNHFLQEGDIIPFGTGEYEVLHTPGHSEGLVVFYNKTDNVLLSTDHILPKITPNISYWFYGEANPLQSFEYSLQKIKKLNAELVIPSHGNPFYDANKRIDEIWEHHLERFDMTLDAIKGGATVFEVCEVLFPFELNTYDYQFAIGEAIAHLEYLRAKNECTRTVHQGMWVYEQL